MLYNFFKFLQDETTGITFNAPGFFADSDDTVTAVLPTGGEVYRQQHKQEETFQIMTRGRDPIECLNNANAVYNVCYDRYNCILPTNTVSSVVYAAVSNANINPIQKPESFGKDEAGRWIYGFNVIILAGKQT